MNLSIWSHPLDNNKLIYVKYTVVLLFNELCMAAAMLLQFVTAFLHELKNNVTLAFLASFWLDDGRRKRNENKFVKHVRAWNSKTGCGMIIFSEGNSLVWLWNRKYTYSFEYHTAIVFQNSTNHSRDVTSLPSILLSLTFSELVYNRENWIEWCVFHVVELKGFKTTKKIKKIYVKQPH